MSTGMQMVIQTRLGLKFNHYFWFHLSCLRASIGLSLSCIPVSLGLPSVEARHVGTIFLS